MVLKLVALILVLGIAFVNSIFGFYSGMINAMAVIIGAVAAFGYYEPLNDLLTGSAGLHPSYAAPCAFMLIFLLTVIILRALADKYLRGNVNVPSGLDWAGGAVFGVVIAQVMVGMLVIGILMLPFGGNVMGYTGLVRTDERTAERRVVFAEEALWLAPDQFTVKLVGLITNGALRGEVPMAAVIPDFKEWVVWTANTVQPESLTAPLRGKKSGGDGFEKGVRVQKWWTQTTPVEARYREELPTRDNREPPYRTDKYAPDAGNVLLGVDFTLDPSSADADKNARYHRFRPTQIRLVGEVDGVPAQFFPRVMENVDPKIEGKARIVDPDNSLAVPSQPAGNEIRAYFDVPEGFTPSFIEYRRFARRDFASAEQLETPPTESLAGLLSPEARAARQREAERGFLAAIKTGSGNTNSLPFNLEASAVRRAGLETKQDEVVSGRIFGAKDRYVGDDIKKFEIPDGYGLLQIRVDGRQARSLAGQVFNYVAKTVNQYYAIDNTGDRHLLDGYYAIVKRGNEEYIELFYTGEPDSPTFRGMLDFKQIESGELDNEDTELCLMFLVKRGTTIRAIHNQAGDGPDGLNFPVN